MKVKILIVEDEQAIRAMVRYSMVKAGYDVVEAENIIVAAKLIHQQRPDIILLDWMLPGGSGIELLKKLKQNEVTANIPIIMLSAKAAEDNKVTGLMAGADDYMTKPFSPKELCARIEAVLRRGIVKAVDGTISVKALCIDTEQHVVTISGVKLNLTPILYKLLSFFCTHQNRVYSRSQLLDYVWGQAHVIEERTLDVQIKRLRAILKPYGYDRYLKTIRGAGYQFIVDDA